MIAAGFDGGAPAYRPADAPAPAAAAATSVEPAARRSRPAAPAGRRQPPAPGALRRRRRARLPEERRLTATAVTRPTAVRRVGGQTWRPRSRAPHRRRLRRGRPRPGRGHAGRGDQDVPGRRRHAPRRLGVPTSARTGTRRRSRRRPRCAAAGVAVRWHSSGSCSATSARSVAAYAVAVHSVDSVALAEALTGAAGARRDRPLDVSSRSVIDGDPARGGAPSRGVPDESTGSTGARWRRPARAAPGGLMAVAPLDWEPGRASPRCGRDRPRPARRSTRRRRRLGRDERGS